MLNDDHLLAGLLRRLDLDIGLALALATLAAFSSQCLERPYPPLVAGTAGLDTLTDPDPLLGQLLVQQRAGGFFSRHLPLLLHQGAWVAGGPVRPVSC